jgi:hypothetical protein
MELSFIESDGVQEGYASAHSLKSSNEMGELICGASAEKSGLSDGADPP